MIILFDTETTGLTPPSRVPLEHWPRVIEVACVVCEGETIIETFSQLIQPECPIPPKITKITGLTAEDLVGMPLFAAVLPRLMDLFAKCDTAVAHNFEFDRNMIDSETKRATGKPFQWPATTLCTVQQYAHLSGRWLKQGELYEYFMKKPQAAAHRALDDVLALHECLVAAQFFQTLCGGVHDCAS